MYLCRAVHRFFWLKNLQRSSRHRWILPYFIFAENNRAPNIFCQHLCEWRVYLCISTFIAALLHLVQSLSVPLQNKNCCCRLTVYGDWTAEHYNYYTFPQPLCIRSDPDNHLTNKQCKIHCYIQFQLLFLKRLGVFLFCHQRSACHHLTCRLIWANLTSENQMRFRIHVMCTLTLEFNQARKDEN